MIGHRSHRTPAARQAHLRYLPMRNRTESERRSLPVPREPVGRIGHSSAEHEVGTATLSALHPSGNHAHWTAVLRQNRTSGNSQTLPRGATQRYCSSDGPRYQTAYPLQTTQSGKHRNGQVRSSVRSVRPVTRFLPAYWEVVLLATASPSLRLCAVNR